MAAARQRIGRSRRGDRHGPLRRRSHRRRSRGGQDGVRNALPRLSRRAALYRPRRRGQSADVSRQSAPLQSQDGDDLSWAEKQKRYRRRDRLPDAPPVAGPDVGGRRSEAERLMDQSISNGLAVARRVGIAASLGLFGFTLASAPVFAEDVEPKVSPDRIEDVPSTKPNP